MEAFVFRRKEVKYLLDDRQRLALEALLQQNMAPDVHQESLVCNVYYDTPDARLIRRSLEKPVYKEKLRLRCYGAAREDTPVFLELKKKYKGVVYKRRITMDLGRAEACLAGDLQLPDSQIGREIDYFLRFYSRIRPAMYLSYLRHAYVGREDPGLRVTLDTDVCFRTRDLTLALPPDGEMLLEPGQHLMEVKTAEAMPLWLVHEITQLGIQKISFSKYGAAYLRLLTRRQMESRGKNYAG